MLYGATSAYAEMRTDRSDTFAARPVDVEQPAPIRMPGDGLDLDRLAGQGAGHVDRAVGAGGDAVAVVTELVNHKAFSHAGPR
jgi:hypothetical protein